MILCITEKPSVAGDIAKILKADIRRDGFYEGNGYKVTWTFGHLCTLMEPSDYTPAWKRWSLSSLPMLPSRFGIKVIPQQSIERQFHVIESLVSQADEVINCGDAGQEGELIQRWVMQKARVGCTVRRLWISSLTDQSIRDGFGDLKPQENFDNLYYAGLSRAIGDWILGLNATRLYSLKYSEPGKVLSVGRVQTPTLALIVQRQREIDNFKSEDFWELKTVYRDVQFNSRNLRFAKEEDATEAVNAISGLPFEVTAVEQKKGREGAPRLFDLTSLQVECNKRWGWSADETLKLIQSLYEKKTTTYPRVDTTYLSEDVYKDVPGILRKMTAYKAQTEPLLDKKLPKSKKVFDNSKVTDHHAIIPTGESPSVLVGNERLMYHLIALRFIGVFYPDCEYMQTTVDGKSGKFEFRAVGKVVEMPGWRVLIQDDRKKDQEEDERNRILPPFVKGESGPHTPSTVKKSTQPPKFYTEGTLLRAMETAGRSIDDEELRDAMKENGIGRPSTRAAIIETLFKRGYIARQRKSLVATQAGMELIDTIDNELLKSAKLTGIWERKLRMIERGEYSAKDFVDELKALISQIVLEVLRDNSRGKIKIDNPAPKESAKKSSEGPGKEKSKSVRITKYEQVKCPVCGKGHMIRGRRAWGCSCYAGGCRFVIPFSEYPADLTPSKLNNAIKKMKK